MFNGVSIPFSRPFRTSREIEYINQVLISGNSAGGGNHSSWCAEWLEEVTGAKKAFLTNSATDALEMAALLLDFNPGDEVIMPSFTFSSTANAFVLRGVVPVFVDVDPNSMNLNIEQLEPAITSKTKAILIVHYAGASCDMRFVQKLCKERGLVLIEDAAQAILAKYDGQYLGTFGDLACISFHASKNVVCGEGGALLLNDMNLIDRAKVILEKGTNREKYIAGEIDKYSWVDIGSSFLMSEIAAAYLHAQFEEALQITDTRKAYWTAYRTLLQDRMSQFAWKLQEYHNGVEHNAHIFYLILPDADYRKDFIIGMRENGIVCASHYVPLHSSEAGLRFGRQGSNLSVTDSYASRLVRLPVWSMEQLPIERIVDGVFEVSKKLKGTR
jgi:dTDP-4-amino-4,6-dideoxygalactose transaminase